MRRDELYLLDMVEAARDALRAVESISREEFERDRTRQLAVRLALQIIGEAARNVSEPTRRQVPSIAWTQIVGLRHLLVHRYFRVDLLTIWEIVHRELPPLIAALGPITGSGGEDQRL